MDVYMIDTVVSDDGKIELPESLKKLFNHRVKVILKSKTDKKKKKKTLNIPTFYCGGKVREFSREDFYDNRF